VRSSDLRWGGTYCKKAALPQNRPQGSCKHTANCNRNSKKRCPFNEWRHQERVQVMCYHPPVRAAARTTPTNPIEGTALLKVWAAAPWWQMHTNLVRKKGCSPGCGGPPLYKLVRKEGLQSVLWWPPYTNWLGKKGCTPCFAGLPYTNWLGKKGCSPSLGGVPYTN
jgi:hypothetical protein